VNRVVTQIRSFCSSHLFDEKLLVVPSLVAGEQIVAAVGRSGQPVVKLRVATTQSLAAGIVRDAISAEGLRAISTRECAAIVEEVCAETIGPSSPFHPFRDQPPLYRALVRTLDDLRLGGVAIDRLPDALLSPPGKRRDLAAMLDRYQTLLEERRLIDPAGVLLRAVAKLESGGHDRLPLALIASRRESRIERRLVELLAEGGITVVEHDRLADSTPDAGAVSLIATEEVEDEIRRIFESLTASQAGEAEIVYSAADPYLPLIAQIADESEVDCTFAGGRPVAFTRPGRFAMFLLEWFERDFDSPLLAGALHDGIVAVEHPQRLSSLLRELRIGWGASRYPAVLDEAAGGADSARGADLAALRGLTTRLIAAAPDPENDGLLALNRIASSVGDAVQEYAPADDAAERDAREAIVAAMRSCGSLTRIRTEPVDATTRLRESILELTSGAAGPRRGSIHVSPLHDGGWSGRPHLFVVGLDSASAGDGSLEDPLLPDRERRAINRLTSEEPPPLPVAATGGTALDLERIVASGGPVTLSFASRDILTGSHQMPSTALVPVYQHASGDHTAGYEAMLAEIAPASERRSWRERRLHARRDSRERREASRSGEEGSAALPAASDMPRLEQLARCPFSYFLKYVLHVKPFATGADGAAGPLEFGRLIHDLLHTFLLRLRQRGESPDPAGESAEMAALADEILAEALPGADDARESLKSRLVILGETFLAIEQGRPAPAAEARLTTASDADYVHALESLLSADDTVLTGAGELLLGTRGEASADAETLAPLMRDLFDLIAAGTFDGRSTGSECAWCEYTAACRHASGAAGRSSAAHPSS
jgi:RecB family exonuclease